MLNHPLQPVTGNGKHSSKSRPTRAKRTAPRRQSANPFQIGRSAAPALATLPILPAGLPLEYVVPVGLAQSAEIALTLLDAGLLTHTEPSLSPSMMVEQSMAEWFARITQDLNLLQINLAMTTDAEGLNDCIDNEEAKAHFKVKGDALHLGVSFGGWYWFTLKEKFEVLEAKVEGLGETAIHWLDTHIHRLCTAVTPNFTLCAAQYAYWGGEDDEVGFADVYGENVEDMDVYSRAEFDAAFPKHAYQAGQKLDKGALQGLLSHPDREVASLAAMLLEPEIEDGVGGAYLQQFSDEHLPIMEPAVCIAWEEKDHTVQIVDDYWNMEMECGYGTDYHAMWTVENSAEGILKGIASVERYVDELKKVENVLSIIATRNDNI
ncbi:PRTRC system protein F [Geomonas subterranea]|uniref:PRTRC system protein F n=1 Tax=Geomonas subterranea TaxID=2847989 RepID=UPI001CD737B0|nr:PRTRC system protein F [Geomonas fuzhouensis]